MKLITHKSLVHAIPTSWESNIQQMSLNTDILAVKDHHIKESRIITVTL